MYLPRQPSSIYTTDDDTLSPLSLELDSQAPTTSSSGFMSKAKQWWKSKAWTTPKPKITSKLLNALAIRNSQFPKKWGHLNSEMSPGASVCTPTHISFGENFQKNPARK